MLFKSISIKITTFITLLITMSAAQAHPGHEHSTMEPIITAIGYGALALTLVVVLWCSYKSYSNKGDA